MDTNSERGMQTAEQHIDLDPTEPHYRLRRGDRRDPDGGLFAYQGPERRSGRDRRAAD